jgi:hypothetical protein
MPAYIIKKKELKMTINIIKKWIKLKEDKQ